MATTLGGTTLAEPNYEREGYTVEAVDVGAFHEHADGSATYDYVTTRYKYNLTWNAITESERNTIRTRYEVKTAQAFSPPDTATTYTVICMPNTFKSDYLEDGDGTRRYYCELSLMETS